MARNQALNTPNEAILHVCLSSNSSIVKIESLYECLFLPSIRIDDTRATFHRDRASRRILKGFRDRTLMPTMALDGRRQFDRSYEEILALPSLSIYIYPLKARERIFFLDENRFRAAVFDSFEFPSK